MAVPGAVREAGAELLGDAPAQLRRSRPGVGDDEEVVDIGLLLPQDPEEEALHQHPGLAAPGGGGDQEAPAPVLHHGPLVFSQLDAHAFPPFRMVSSTWSQNSAGVTGRSGFAQSSASSSMKWQAEANSQ